MGNALERALAAAATHSASSARQIMLSCISWERAWKACAGASALRACSARAAARCTGCPAAAVAPERPGLVPESHVLQHVQALLSQAWRSAQPSSRPRTWGAEERACWARRGGAAGQNGRGCDDDGF